MQPTGNLHLGNYLGALKNFVSLQHEAECIYCVVDLHAITTFQDPKTLRSNIFETTAAFIASGIDDSKNIIFNQSSVSGHAELSWILSCVSRMGWLNRMTQFKDKAGKDKEKASVGLYIYTFVQNWRFIFIKIIIHMRYDRRFERIPGNMIIFFYSQKIFR